MPLITLPQMTQGEWGEITHTDTSLCNADRLTELGFLPGNRVCRLYSDRKETLSVYQIADACIALRGEDAACIQVRVG